MNEAPTAPEELISRHFDGPLSPPDHQRLADALLTDPAVRADFVATARLHAGLESLAPVKAMDRNNWGTRKKAWLALGIAAAIAIGLYGFMASWGAKVPDPSQVVEHSIEEMDLPPVKAGKKRIVQMKSVAAAPQSPGLKSLLSQFYVNVSPSGLSVREALPQLEEAIQRENFFKRTELASIKFSVDENGSGIDSIVKIQRDAPMTISDYLAICGSSCEITVLPVGLRFSGKPNFDPGDDFPSGIFWSGPLRLIQEVITGPASLLPSNFDRNSGIILSESAWRAFKAGIPRSDEVRRTGEISVGIQLRNYIYETSHEEIDQNDRFRKVIDAPTEWLKCVSEVKCKLSGELLCAYGSVQTMGWRNREAYAVRAGDGSPPSVDAQDLFSLASLPTEFEVWIPTGSAALFVLDSPTDKLVTIMCLRTELRSIKPGGR